MTTNGINKRTIIELEHPDTGKICHANCVCCAKSKVLENGLSEGSSMIYICTKITNYKKRPKNRKPGFSILSDLNHCCGMFELSRDFTGLGYKVVGKYGVKIAKDKKVVK